MRKFAICLGIIFLVWTIFSVKVIIFDGVTMNILVAFAGGPIIGLFGLYGSGVIWHRYK